MDFVDDLGQSLQVDTAPQRVVSLVPSLTELLFDLGLEERVVGVTKFCIHPAGLVKNKQKIGGTKNVNFERLRALNPDFIIANKEENSQADIEELMLEFKVYVTDIITLEDAYHSIDAFGKILGCETSATSLIKRIRHEFSQLKVHSTKKVLYIIWKSPWMTIGEDTFIQHLFSYLGFENVVKDMRYPVLEDHDINALKPELVLLSSEPYPFAEKHLSEVQTLFPQAKILLVDGEMFSWYGSRLALAPAYFARLLESIN